MEEELVILSKSVIEAGNLKFEEKKALLDEIRKLRPASENRWNHRWVIFALALVALSAPIALLLKIQPELPQSLISLSSTALGSLATFMTSVVKK